ncbi:ABC transporter substrate-binding protein [Streptacidiphilus sp. P02-A3a]|uniref:ABC transporter substrate-binding protein n=1 Tax=Streptacidiphilus sp. P02-A3a TaxID=2704468 RepID=UPI0015F7E83D|nr:ABC transporter substrate-binding protein [Streptacidiphilus sp. P02-A3a]QMU69040.1 peptide-binding protein [Streptacidiphilus sp. P02-A3a]
MSAAKRLATLGCVGLLATTSACASSGSSSSGVSGESKTSITMGTIEAYSSLDPAGAYDNGSWMLFYNIYQRLLSYAPGATIPTPDAASSCAFVGSADTTYTCTLRPGLTFSNGDPLNAAAVKFSLDRVVEIGKLKRDNGSGVSILLSTLQSVSTSGDLGVTFHLNTPDATFPDRLASGVGSIVDPRTFSGTSLLTGNDPVASGVYKVDSVQLGSPVDGKANPQSVSMSLNPNYKGQAISSTSKAMNSSVTMKYYADSGSVMKALSNGDIDLNASSDLAAADLVRLQAQQVLGKGLQVDTGAGTETRMIILNVKNGPFTDPAARRAVAELVDRDAIADNVYQRTVVPLYSLIPQGIGDATTPFEDLYQTGPSSSTAAEVKSQLNRAGVKLPISFPYYYARSTPGSDAEAALIKQQLEVDGIFQVSLKPVPTLNDLITQWSTGKIEASVSGWSADYPDPDDYVSPFLGSPGTFGSYYTDSEISNTLTPETLKLDDRGSALAQSTFAKIQTDLAKDAAYIPLWQDKQFIVTQGNITGVPLTLDTAEIMRFWMVGKS